MNAIEALNEYKTKAWRVDDALCHIIITEIERLREALEFYADEKHYELYCMGEPSPCDVTEDGGYIARQALKEVKNSMKETASKYCGECLCDFTPGEIAWYAQIENRSFCEACKNKLTIKDWEPRMVPNREENSK